MHTDLQHTIECIFDHLRNLGRPVAEKRRAGADETFIREELRGLGMGYPDDIIKLYSVCDGTDSSAGDRISEICFFPGYYWLPLSDAVQVYKSISGDRHWDRWWLPIFASGGGDFYAVICNESSDDFGNVVGFLLRETDHIVEFKSVTTMFQTIERSFVEKAFYAASGYLEADYPKMRAIARAMQPDFAEHDVSASKNLQNGS
jgi:cell wall assembly regulator SMI1